MTTPVTVDVNVFVRAVVGGNDSFHSWPSPPPVRGNLAANVVGILNDCREFALYVSEHILANTLRVLAGKPPDGYGWDLAAAEEYAGLLVEIADASGGGVVEPTKRVSDCRDFEDNRILECAASSGSVIIVSDDSDLLEMSPWKGIPVFTSEQFVQRTDAMRRSRGR